ncbi:hypothetical protein EVAR_7213_1 [Eumeta japonica]|uniref:Uncharacterized protein n=1 Tax=Eumeta variegata TaxID=151549 RepID=A0A4C1T4W0_EUMVA|nr:hypothetical protein EVAR_7213_1 [Eumeta japonica]
MPHSTMRNDDPEIQSSSNTEGDQKNLDASLYQNISTLAFDIDAIGRHTQEPVEDVIGVMTPTRLGLCLIIVIEFVVKLEQSRRNRLSLNFGFFRHQFSVTTVDTSYHRFGKNVRDRRRLTYPPQYGASGFLFGSTRPLRRDQDSSPVLA